MILFCAICYVYIYMTCTLVWTILGFNIVLIVYLRFGIIIINILYIIKYKVIWKIINNSYSEISRNKLGELSLKSNFYKKNY